MQSMKTQCSGILFIHNPLAKPLCRSYRVIFKFRMRGYVLLSLLVLIACTDATIYMKYRGRSRGYFVNMSAARQMASINTKEECAAQCDGWTDCQGFAYSQNSRVCLMYSCVAVTDKPNQHASSYSDLTDPYIQRKTKAGCTTTPLQTLGDNFVFTTRQHL